MMRICFLPLYRIERPSSRYRVFQLLPALKRHGVDISVLPAPEKRLGARLLYLPRLFWAARHHDVLFFQKRTLPSWALFLLLRLNKHLVFDMDDAIYLRRNIDRMLQTAVAVIVGNETLAAYAQNHNKNVTIIPTIVDTEQYKTAVHSPAPRSSRIILGWIGSDPNRGDFDGMKPILDWLGDTFGDKICLRIIAARTLSVETTLSIEWIPWTLAGSIPALQTFDIGMMPLPDNEWNRGKCGLKLIQTMAVSIPIITSPTGANADIVEDGVTGFLAYNAEKWKTSLSFLITNTELRNKMGRQARQRMETKYSVEAIMPQFLEVLAKASHLPPLHV